MAILGHTPYNSKALSVSRALLPTSWAVAGWLTLAGCGSSPPPQPPAGAKAPAAPPAVELGAEDGDAPKSDAGGSGTTKAGE